MRLTATLNIRPRASVLPQARKATITVTGSGRRLSRAVAWNEAPLSIRAGEGRGTARRCRQAALEPTERSFRQDSEHRTGTRKVLQGSDALFRKPDTACRSRVGCTPDMNQDA